MPNVHAPQRRTESMGYCALCTRWHRVTSTRVVGRDWPLCSLREVVIGFWRDLNNNGRNLTNSDVELEIRLGLVRARQVL